MKRIKNQDQDQCKKHFEIDEYNQNIVHKNKMLQKNNDKIDELE